MILTIAQSSLIPFGIAAVIAYHLLRGLKTGSFQVRGSQIERANEPAFFWIYVYTMVIGLGVFVYLGCKLLYVSSYM